jgi:hypothetical protein
MLARHWPEFGGLIDVHQQRAWMTLVRQFPGPQCVAADGAQAAQTLHDASRKRFPKDRIEEFVARAGTTVGVPMTRGEQERFQHVVEVIEQHTQQLDAIDDVLADSVGCDPSMAKMALVVGPACAAAIVAYVGSPIEFQSPSALEKAIGLNLKIRSSGNEDGKLTIGITKRGPAHVRQLLYLAALRMVKGRIVGAWFRARRSYNTEAGKKKAVVAVMRKLARALWHVARGNDFDPSKLFDVRRLELTTTSSQTTADAQALPSQTQTASTRKTNCKGGVDQPTA